MSIVISSQIDNRNFALMPRRESAGVDSTPRISNEGSKQNFITEGAATLAHFFVMLAHQALPAFARKPINQTQGRGLQLNKILQ